MFKNTTAYSPLECIKKMNEKRKDRSQLREAKRIGEGLGTSNLGLDKLFAENGEYLYSSVNCASDSDSSYIGSDSDDSTKNSTICTVCEKVAKLRCSSCKLTSYCSS